MYKRIVIVGKGGSGKDFLKKKFIERGYLPGVSCTTREPREDEVKGVDYHFLSDFEFKEKGLNGEFLETDCFNNWWYGTSLAEFAGGRADVFIMTPRGVAKIPGHLRKSTLIIYLDIEDDVLRNRLSTRKGMNDTVERRMESDREQFRLFGDFDIRITNPYF